MKYPILTIFERFVRSMGAPMAPIDSYRKCVERTQKKLKNEPNLTAVAQSVQKLCQIQENFPKKLRWKLVTPFHRVKNEFFKKSAKGMISLRLDLVSYT